MDVREKLIDILRKPIFPYELVDPIEAVADYLLDSGVTVQENMEISDELLKQLKNAPITNWKEEPSIEVVQEWISVTERLPDWRDGKVLVFTKYGFSICERTVNNRWRGQHANWITHWAYLPKPPKGE